MTTAIKRDLADNTEQTVAVEPPLKRFWGLLVGLLVALLAGYALWVSPASEREGGQAQISQAGGTNDGLSTAVPTLPGRARAIPEAGLAMPQVWWQSPTAQAKANKTLIRRMYAEMATEGSLAGVDRLFSADFRHHEPGAVTEAVDLATFLEQLKRQQATFYELRYAIEDMVAEGDQVVVRWTAGGTPLKTFETDPPTGQPAVWRGVTIWRVVEGEIVAGWTVSEASSPQLRAFSVR
jgi:predicted ester cyclase